MRPDNPKSLRKAEQERRWLDENRQALEAYNEGVAKHGLLSDVAGVLGATDVAAKRAP